MSLSKTRNPLLSTGSTQETFWHDWNRDNFVSYHERKYLIHPKLMRNYEFPTRRLILVKAYFKTKLHIALRFFSHKANFNEIFCIKMSKSLKISTEKIPCWWFRPKFRPLALLCMFKAWHYAYCDKYMYQTLMCCPKFTKFIIAQVGLDVGTNLTHIKLNIFMRYTPPLFSSCLHSPFQIIMYYLQVLFVCLIWFFMSHQQSFSYKGTDLPG